MSDRVTPAAVRAPWPARWTARLPGLLRSRWLVLAAVVVAAATAAYNLGHLPHASLVPALLALLPWTLGKYVLCPLRWHSLSASGQPRRWHLRTYAESELLGLLTPARAGTDLWRIHQLHRRGMDRPAAVADVALDRIVGAVGLTAFSVIGGATLPPRLLVVALGAAAVAVVGALAVRRLRPDLLSARPRPSRRAVVRGLLLSMLYQSTVLLLLLGSVAAVGHTVPPLALMGLFGATQIAAAIPGVQGAGPREGALVAGLVALGLPWQSALGAVSLSAVLAWLPGLLIGGTCLVVGRVVDRRLARAGADASGAPLTAAAA